MQQLQKLLFQYLMVQLKEGGQRKDKKSKYISIPHGTIKRIAKLLLYMFAKLFQYLMVQLKDGSNVD